MDKLDSKNKYLVLEQENEIKKAEAGNVLAAKKVLQKSMVALSRVIDGTAINQSELKALEFVHQALRNYLWNDIPFERAFCVEKSSGGQEANVSNFGYAIWVTLKVDEELDKQKKLGSVISVKGAISKVAIKIEKGYEHVRVCWQKVGGMKGYKERGEW